MIGRFQLLLFLFSISYLSNGQQEQERRLSTFKQSNITLNLYNGITRASYLSDFGQHHPTRERGFVHQLAINHTSNFSDALGLTFGLGLGAFPVYESFTSSQVKFNYGFGVDYNPFVSLKSELNHRKMISYKRIFNSFIGLNLFSFRESATNSSFGIGNQNNIGSQILKYKYEKGWNPVVNIGVGVSRILKDNNLLSLRMDYNHSFQNFFDGTFDILSGTPDFSSGKYFNRGHHFNVGMGYTFSRANKNKAILKYYNEGSGRDALINYKKEQRTIKPQTIMISSMYGLAFQISRKNDPMKLISNQKFVSSSGYFSLEYNLSNHYYAEIGFGIQEYGYQYNYKNLGFGFANYNFNAYQLSIGGGKRIVGKQNLYNYLNIATGIVFNSTDNLIGRLYSNRTIYNLPNDSSIRSYSFNNGLRKNNLLMYVGLNKDFRIYRGLYFNLMYRYHQGFARLSDTELFFSKDEDVSFQKANISLNGSFHAYQLGFKFKFGDPVGSLTKKDAYIDEPRNLSIDYNFGFSIYRFKNESVYDGNLTRYNDYGIALQTGLSLSRSLDLNYQLESSLMYQKLYTEFMNLDITNLGVGVARSINIPNGNKTLNVHAGANLGYVFRVSSDILNYVNFYSANDTILLSTISFDKPNHRGEYQRNSITGNDTTNLNSGEFGLLRRFIPSVYIGLSKEFRLNERVSLSLRYNRMFGMQTFYYENENINDDSYHMLSQSNFRMTGTASQFLLKFNYYIR